LRVNGKAIEATSRSPPETELSLMQLSSAVVWLDSRQLLALFGFHPTTFLSNLFCIVKRLK